MKTLFNIFSHQLKKDSIFKIDSEPVYKNKDYCIYKRAEKWYIYTYKNLVICERCGVNKQMIQDIINNKYLGEKDKIYLNFERPIESKKLAIKTAKKLNFSIN